ncbi:MAG: hypothetical protein HYT94_00860 [Parcubacteria group bacterium]|nr:hypothetical protein [Parcubacteria group bacterium]
MPLHIISRLFVFLLVVASGLLLNASSLFAADYELTGWAWGGDNNIQQGKCDLDGLPPPGDDKPQCITGGVGWVSFSNTTEGIPAPFYKVTIDSVTGDFSGYAWSSNLGWISFNVPDATHPKAKVNMSGGGVQPVTGWARACSVFVSGCSGALYSDVNGVPTWNNNWHGTGRGGWDNVSERGGWDGWVSLGGMAGGVGWKVDTDMTPMRFLTPTTCNGAVPGVNYCYAWGGNGAANTPPPWLVAGHASPIGWLMASNLVINTTPPPPLPTLSFLADKYVLSDGQSTTLRWLTGGNISDCMASGNWTEPPVKAFDARVWHSEVITPSPAGVYTYNLQCTGSDGPTPLRTVVVTVTSGSVPENGACGTAHGKPSKIKPPSPPSLTLCSAGNLKSPGVIQNGDMWEWTCAGVDGGLDTVQPFCSAPKTKFFKIKVF